MNTNYSLLIFTTLIFLFSCNSKQGEQLGYGQGSGDGVSMMEEPPAIEEKISYNGAAIKANEAIPDEDNTETNALEGKPILVKKKVIKDGNISIKTKDIIASKKDIDQQLKLLNGYYEREDLENNDQSISYDLKIRVPTNNFEKLISSVENDKDEVISKSIQARDVTGEYVDIETRLTNKREYLRRYKELLSKASSVKDILAIEENIRILQEEIESKEGRLKYLSDQVSFSTLNLNLFKTKEFIYKPEHKDKFSERIKTSLSNGWTSIVGFVIWLISIWPFMILIVLAFFLRRRVIKKR